MQRPWESPSPSPPGAAGIVPHISIEQRLAQIEATLRSLAEAVERLKRK